MSASDNWADSYLQTLSDAELEARRNSIEAELQRRSELRIEQMFEQISTFSRVELTRLKEKLINVLGEFIPSLEESSLTNVENQELASVSENSDLEAVQTVHPAVISDGYIEASHSEEMPLHEETPLHESIAPSLEESFAATADQSEKLTASDPDATSDPNVHLWFELTEGADQMFETSAESDISSIEPFPVEQVVTTSEGSAPEVPTAQPPISDVVAPETPIAHVPVAEASTAHVPAPEVPTVQSPTPEVSTPQPLAPQPPAPAVANVKPVAIPAFLRRNVS
ncbi:MAG TPA: hypothetical protein V6C78_28400 [Crinalium sp.]|jgi:hypothetical protein